jgi:hypothetical protein
MKASCQAQPAVSADSAEALRVLADYRDAHRKFLGLIAAGIGPPDLIGELGVYVIEMVEALARAAETHPALVAGLARESVAWPVMVARHLPRGADFTALADRIELGADMVVSVSPRARYRWDAPLVRFLLKVIQHHFLATPKEFFFLRPPEHQPRLTRRSLPWYLDEFVMPLLDGLREKQGDWEGVPAVAALTQGVTGAAAQRRVVRTRIRETLLELAGPEDGGRSELKREVKGEDRRTRLRCATPRQAEGDISTQARGGHQTNPQL